MIMCPEGWHPNPDQRDGDFNLAGFRMKVDPHFGDERVVVTCYCGYPRLGHLIEAATFRVDDPWDWPWDEEVAS